VSSRRTTSTTGCGERASVSASRVDSEHVCVGTPAADRRRTSRRPSSLSESLDDTTAASIAAPAAKRVAREMNPFRDEDTFGRAQERRRL
jgi:hypothetical protein